MNPVFKSRPNELITTTDGRKLYHSRSVAVVMVLGAYFNSQLYVVIEKRGTAPGLDKQGLWCLPCGYLDWDESGPNAVKRELWEEVGVNLDEIKLRTVARFIDQPWHVKTEPDENRQNITLRYGLVYDNVTELPKLIPNNACDHPDEVADAKWILVPDMEQYNFAFNHDKVIVEFLKKLG